MRITFKDTESKLRWLKRHHYKLKESSMGYWVDGANGFLVSGYFRYEHEAIKAAFERVREAKSKRETPVWLF